jgi:hypothetical protein
MSHYKREEQEDDNDEGGESNVEDIGKLLLGAGGDPRSVEAPDAAEDEPDAAIRGDECGVMCDEADREKCCELAMHPLFLIHPEYQAMSAAKEAYDAARHSYSILEATKSDFEHLNSLYATSEATKAEWKSSPAKKDIQNQLAKCKEPKGAAVDGTGCRVGGTAGEAARRGARNAQRVRRIKRMVKRVIMRVVRKIATDRITVSSEQRLADATEYLQNITETQNLLDNRTVSLKAALNATADPASAEGKALGADVRAAQRLANDNTQKVMQAKHDTALAQEKTDFFHRAQAAQMFAAQVSVEAEDKVKELAKQIADETDRNVRDALDAKREKLAQTTRDAWNDVPDAFSAELPEEEQDALQENLERMEKSVKTPFEATIKQVVAEQMAGGLEKKRQIELGARLGKIHRKMDRMLREAKEHVMVEAERASIKNAKANSQAAEKASRAAEADLEEAQRLKMLILLRAAAQTSDEARNALQPAVETAEHRVEMSREEGHKQRVRARAEEERASELEERLKLREVGLAVEGNVLGDVMDQLGNLTQVVNHVTSGPLVRVVEREIAEVRESDRRKSKIAAHAATAAIEDVVAAAETERTNMRARARARRVASAKVRETKRFLSQQFKFMTRKFAQLDQAGFDVRRATEATVIEQSAMKAAKKSLDVISTLEATVKKAVTITKSGEIMEMAGGAINAGSWWLAPEPQKGPSGCNTWTHLETARTALAMMRSEVKRHTLNAKIHALRGVGAAEVTKLEEVFEESLATARAPLAALPNNTDALPTPAEIQISLGVEAAESDLRRHFQKSRVAVLEDSLQKEAKLADAARTLATKRIADLEELEARLKPAARRPKFAPKEIQDLTKFAVEKATIARDAKKVAEATYSKSQKTFLTVGEGETEDGMTTDIKKAEHAEATALKYTKISKEAEVQLKEAMSKFERKRRLAEVELEAVYVEIATQSQIRMWADKIQREAVVHATVMRKAEEGAVAAYEQSLGPRTLLKFEFDAVVRAWEAEVNPETLLALERNARQLAWETRDASHDGGPEGVDVTIEMQRDEAHKDHAQTHVDTLTASMKPLKELVAKMREKLDYLSTDINGSRHKHRTAFRRAVRMSELKLRWAEEMVRNAQFELRLATGRLARSKDRRNRILGVQRQSEEELQKLLKHVMSDEAIMAGAEPKTIKVYDMYVDAQVKETHRLVSNIMNNVETM